MTKRLLDFYDMRNQPFERDIPPEEMYVSNGMREADAFIRYAVQNNSFAVLVGESGTGKSTLLRKVATTLPEQGFHPFYICDSALTPGAFYRTILAQMGFQPRRSSTEAKEQLHEALSVLSGLRGARPACFCDEGHLLSLDMIREIRFILNKDFDSTGPFGFILCGQDQLLDTLAMPACAAVRQRVDYCCILKPFTRDETGSYVQRRLEYAGTHEPVFTDSAIDCLHDLSGGIARVIDKIAASALLYGFQSQKRLLDAPDIRPVLASQNG